ncbi:MAG: replication-associated recombination protein A [Bacteroidales bacterium]
MQTTFNTPLAEILRPSGMESYAGQEHLTAPGAVLYESIRQGKIPSMIFWGPPGVGKTTLAYLIAHQLDMQFFTLSAISSGVKEVRAVIDEAKSLQGKAILFIDEIHRFSKSQQDSLLGAVERGILTLIGATTENPSFEVISPLLSRCQVYVLKPLTVAQLESLIKKATEHYKTGGIVVDVQENEALLRFSGGDARKLYNAMQLVVESLPSDKPVLITNEKVMKIVQENLAIYDKQGEMHYDVISAFIKSVRGSDPNGSVYWLGRMVEGGEDPKFIARRLLILAAEDIGLANPNALLLANTCFDAIHKIGWPESRIILAETTIYLATSPKSNSAYMAINNAQEEIRRTGDLPVPLPLRNAPTTLMKKLDYSKAYQYSHDFEGNFAEQEFLPERISGKKFYKPGQNEAEAKVTLRLRNWWKNRYNY